MCKAAGARAARGREGGAMDGLRTLSILVFLN